jgi:hypothetical protein
MVTPLPEGQPASSVDTARAADLTDKQGLMLGSCLILAADGVRCSQRAPKQAQVWPVLSGVQPLREWDWQLEYRS